MAWIDNHCHLRADDHAAIADARAAGVTRMITVGTDLEHSRVAASVAESNDGVWATAGVHPHDASQGLDGIVALLYHPKVIAVGEAGLDYYYDHSPRAAQRDAFRIQAPACEGLQLLLHVGKVKGLHGAGFPENYTVASTPRRI